MPYSVHVDWLVNKILKDIKNINIDELIDEENKRNTQQKKKEQK